MPKAKIIFITATDTAVGKTITTLCLGLLLKARGFDVGVMKPVQCAGHDAQFLKKSLGLQDKLRTINPFYAPEPLSPHLAFQRAKIKFDKKKIRDCLKKIRKCRDIVLIEGAGGLMVPLAKGYYNADLIADLKAELIIVARPGLGTINHTLLTINEAQRRGLPIKGLIFCQSKPGRGGLPEKTNPQELKKLSGVKVLGSIPYSKSLNPKKLLRLCRETLKI